MQLRTVYRQLLVGLSLFILAAVACSPAYSQTATSGVVLGTVSDATGAVMVGAKVELVNTATNATRSAVTGNAGQYLFVDTPPGTYRLRVSQNGFRTASIQNIKVDVARSSPIDVRMEVGDVISTVEVSAESRVDLQTTDSQIGNVLGSEPLLRLPSFRRSAADFLVLQPGVQPGGGNTGGTVTGARSDQNTYNLDGIDVTDNVIGSLGGVGIAVPLPVDSVEEFRVGVTNPNATFGRSAGGQVALTGRRGTNTLHGAAYWYHQNDNLNAHSWTSKRFGNDAVTGRPVRPEAELKDNRFGARLGGPLWRDKTFLFGHYEGRRFPQATDIVRVVPSSALRQGILQFQDAANNVVSYNLRTSTLCGAGATACDPRGIGISPTINSLWSQLPAGNDPSFAGGDGLNTIGFRSAAPSSQDENFAVMRLDHALSTKWQLTGSYSYSRILQANAGQLDIRGGNVQAAASTPNRGDTGSLGVNTQITPNLSSQFRFGMVRSRFGVATITPTDSSSQLALAGTAAGSGFFALDLGAMDEPVDVDTQRARSQYVNSRSWQFAEDATWIKGSHTVQFGANFRRLPLFHTRDDKVLGSLAHLGAAVTDGTFITIPGSARPPTCAGAVTTNCLAAADATRWNIFYSAALGLVDNLSVLATRDGGLNLQPLGTPLIADTVLGAYEFYAQDAWRVTKSLTLTYGMAYQWQTAPKEKNGKQTFIIDNSNGQEITTAGYLRDRRAAAAAGQIFNPQIAYVPINSSTTRNKIFDTDWNNWGPRLSAAWQPSFSDGWLGKMFGDRKTVLRGGYGIVYDRINTVQSVVIPTLGVGFATTITVNGPNCNATGAGGAGCVPTGSDPISAFRVGVDGTLPIPVAPASVSIPIVPATGLSELLSFQVDPALKVAMNHSVDFTLQRELPWNMLFEVGYAGRMARNLPRDMNLNAVPIFQVDSASGQTFAQAFDAVATQLRTVAAVTPQPWFENQFPGLGTLGLLGFGLGPQFSAGQTANLFLTLNFIRPLVGLPSFTNLQVGDQLVRASGARSNYHAFLATIRKRTSHGLAFDLNYTLSKSLDEFGLIQNSVGFPANSFFTDVDYGPSFFDRTHVFNALIIYDLPFGRGRHFAGGSNELVNKFIGGWYLSSIFTSSSGLPFTVFQSGDAFGSGFALGGGVAAIPRVGSGSFGNEVHTGVAGSGGIGTGGNPAAPTLGTGLNRFADPQQAFNSFRQVLLSSDGRTGRANPLRGFSRWNLDMSIGKKTSVTERVNLLFSADFFNIFNHPQFFDPGASLLNRANFGVVTTQFVPANRTQGSRWIQMGLRVEF